ncbi:rhamnogalacturonidase [Mucilaginibacter glaciei]|uniref:Glycoside hydrolase family 28 protein n=1 Tax=Mucilaginibacter glaciei TaxID=2772109 RepID=A0A926P0F8_9SPHI|nr:glycoside hydrolase family 28 protein [Mucilaginibacter glaciei]MBD1395353.1 glycoside hydrolase family 28 protein [Mucilaginibacter glaciei]
MQKLLLIYLFAAVACGPALAEHSPANHSFYNVRDFGAKGDGKMLDSKAINKAIDAAAKAGGGTVFLPAGNYLSGSIHLKSDISVYLEQGATIIATSEENDGEYDAEEVTVNTIYQDSGHSHFHNSLIWGDSLHNVSILGPGRIWGRGLLKDYKKGTRLANKAITLYKCRNVIIRDISILHGGWFAILATGTDNLTIDNVKLDTNRDGMDIDCCKNVRISNCYVNSPYDDGICLKSTFALGYARSTENVTITNCQVSGYDEGTLLDGTYKRTENPEYKFHPTGRIKLGTESNGGFKNIAISNCVFDYCRGLALETVDGAHLEDVVISNITMRDIVNDPIFLRLGARMRGPAGVPVGELRRVTISNVSVYNADPDYTCTISGVPGHNITDVWINNMRLYYKGGVNTHDDKKVIAENENKYPEPGMLGQAPAYGFFIRHAANIKLTDIEINLLNPDSRPAFRADDVTGLVLRQVKAAKSNYPKIAVLNSVNGLQATESLDLK